MRSMPSLPPHRQGWEARAATVVARLRQLVFEVLEVLAIYMIYVWVYYKYVCIHVCMYVYVFLRDVCVWVCQGARAHVFRAFTSRVCCDLAAIWQRFDSDFNAGVLRDSITAHLDDTDVAQIAIHFK